MVKRFRNHAMFLCCGIYHLALAFLSLVRGFGPSSLPQFSLALILLEMLLCVRVLRIDEYLLTYTSAILRFVHHELTLQVFHGEQLQETISPF